jgi:PIN domain nuclease of toxin-antitoxin system
MVILLDTHIAYWTILDSKKMPPLAKSILTSLGNDFYISLASVWEIEIKHMLHPLEMPLSGQEFYKACLSAGMKELPITKEDIFALESLKPKDESHKDPFDRILLASAKTENISFLSADSKLPSYNEKCLIYIG